MMVIDQSKAVLWEKNSLGTLLMKLFSFLEYKNDYDAEGD